MANWDRKNTKKIGERLVADITKSNFKTDIECLALLQELLESTGADVIKIQKETIDGKRTC